MQCPDHFKRDCPRRGKHWAPLHVQIQEGSLIRGLANKLSGDKGLFQKRCLTRAIGTRGPFGSPWSCGASPFLRSLEKPLLGEESHTRGSAMLTRAEETAVWCRP